MNIYFYENSEYAVVDCLNVASGNKLKDSDVADDLYFGNYIFAVPAVFFGNSCGEIDISKMCQCDIPEIAQKRAKIAAESVASGFCTHQSDSQFVLELPVFEGTQCFFVDIKKDVPEIRCIGIEKKRHRPTMSSRFPYYDDEYSNPEYGDR